MVGRGMTLVGWGVAAGVRASALRALLSTLLRRHRRRSRDVRGGVALMLVAALAACGIPAARAVTVRARARSCGTTEKLAGQRRRIVPFKG